VKASRTNTPLHALTTLNDITYIEAARVFAESLLKTSAANDDARIALAMNRSTGRPPHEEEMAILLGSLAKYRKSFEGDSASALALLQVGESKHDSKLPAAEHAAWTNLCNLILNLDETLTKE